jgi:XTP/dITP diphosphohydrolase
LHKLSNSDREPAQVSCIIGYYDGKHLECIENTVDGYVVPPSGINGFGFDKVFIPKGTSKTFAEMSSDEKDMHSHRFNAIKKLVIYLELIS